MNDRLNRIAALANISAYDSNGTRRYIDGAPHIKHASLRALYTRLVLQVYDFAILNTPLPHVLDLGAGEGSVTLPFLDLGAKVTAVDISRTQLDVLQNRCERFGEKLTVQCEDIADTLKRPGVKYDVIVANSFLHHIPDYLGLVSDATNLLTPWGQFFSFQDPLRYDSIQARTSIFETLAYVSWRLFKGDVMGGLKRRFRRRRGIYLENAIEDNIEYHVIRNGVDQDKILAFLGGRGFSCEIVRYFSTQSRLFQPLGSAMRMENTFAVIARRVGGAK